MSDLLEVAKKAARAGGKVAMKYFGTDVEFETKEDKTFVSVADRESEEEIRKIVSAKFPKHEIKGEEGSETGKSNIVWHVDPIDGTSNFKNNIPLSAVSIGIEKDGEFIVGVVYHPHVDELYHAEKGKGAFLNGKPIKVNSFTPNEGIIVIDSSFRGDRVPRKYKAFGGILKRCSRYRMIGCASLQLCWLARGNFVSSLSDAIHSFDFAAGAVIVREAGGIVTDTLGNELSADSKAIVASNNKENHKMVVDVTKQFYKGYKGID